MPCSTTSTAPASVTAASNARGTAIRASARKRSPPKSWGRPLNDDGGDGGESNAPSTTERPAASTSIDLFYGHATAERGRTPVGASSLILGEPYEHPVHSTSTSMTSAPRPSRVVHGRTHCQLIRQRVPTRCRQLIVCRWFSEPEYRQLGLPPQIPLPCRDPSSPSATGNVPSACILIVSQPAHTSSRAEPGNSVPGRAWRAPLWPLPGDADALLEDETGWCSGCAWPTMPSSNWWLSPTCAIGGMPA